MMKYWNFLTVCLFAASISLAAQEKNVPFIGTAVSQGVISKDAADLSPPFREYGLNTVRMKPTPDEDVRKGLTAPSLRVYLPDADRATGRMVIILPGGGYRHLAQFHEGYDWAPYFLSKGIAVGVLKYRMPEGDHEVPYADVRAAFELVRQNAEEWNLNRKEIGIMGSSAGGHLASTFALHAPKEEKPAFQILLYPVISMAAEITHEGSRRNLLGEYPSEEMVRSFSNELGVNEETPPAFVIFAGDDRAVLPANGLRFCEAMTKHGRPVTLLLYPSGGHGFGFRDSFAYKREFLLELDRWLEDL